MSVKRFFTIAFVFLFSCQDDVTQGENSLEGSWEVTQVQSVNDDNPDLNTIESGELGQFFFDEDSVVFSFSRQDSTYLGADRWHLNREKVNQGFFRVNQFTLIIENNFQFICRFEDETKNAERKATEITLSTEMASAPDSFFILSLSKN